MSSFNHFKLPIYKTLEEIKAIDGFAENNPVSLELYAGGFVGDYELNEWVQCCRLKENGTLCGTKHKAGSLPLLQDGTVSLIGNCCAAAKFSHDSQFMKDLARARNERDRLQRLEGLAELVAGSELSLERLAQARTALRQADQSMGKLKSGIGVATLQAIERRVKERRLVVEVNAIYIKRWEEEGEQREERSSSPFKIGFIPHAELWGDREHRSIQTALTTIESAYEDAKALVEQDPKLTEIDAVARKLNELPAALNRVQEYARNVALCLSGDLYPLLYLVDDLGDRVKTARAILQLKDAAAGKGHAKAELKRLDDAFKVQAKCAVIKIRDR